MKCYLIVEARGIPLARVLAGANRHDSPLLEPTLDRLDGLGPSPTTSPCTWTPATTRPPPVLSWLPAI